MIFEDTVTIGAPAPRVWEFLLDPGCIAACLPGVDNLTRVDERTFDAAIVASVGPIAGRFSFRARILESTPPTEMTAELDGVDSVTKSAIRARMAMHLDPRGPQQTAVAYRSTVEVKGRLAIVGEMVLRATAALMVEEFWRRLRTQLETGSA